MKLNIGCGLDYRPGFINIDGNELVKADKYVNLKTGSLLNTFAPETVDLIVADQVIEHFHHWEAINLLKDFYTILRRKGRCNIILPDCEAILKKNDWSIEEKISFLYGGQDKPQPGKHVQERDVFRKAHPEFFCHEYGWIKSSVIKEWGAIFPKIEVNTVDINLRVIAIKT